MTKIWIVILTTAIAPSTDPLLPGVDSMTQEYRVLDEEACRRAESPPTVSANGLYWSARCKWMLIPKPKEEEK